MGNDAVDQAVIFGLFSVHKVVSVGVFFNAFVGLARMQYQNVVDFSFNAQNFFGLNFNIGDLLSFSLVSDSNLGDDYFVSVFAGSYAPGASFLGPKSGTGPWDGSFFDGADLHFQTFVDQSASVPAPGMLAIFGLGLAVIGCARRKRAA